MSHSVLGSPQTLMFSPLTCCESLQRDASAAKVEGSTNLWDKNKHVFY